jgi:hypothetical protein
MVRQGSGHIVNTGGAHLMRYPDLHGHVMAAFG